MYEFWPLFEMILSVYKLFQMILPIYKLLKTNLSCLIYLKYLMLYLQYFHIKT